MGKIERYFELKGKPKCSTLEEEKVIIEEMFSLLKGIPEYKEEWKCVYKNIKGEVLMTTEWGSEDERAFVLNELSNEDPDCYCVMERRGYI